jgi:hypothetical protein
MPAPSYTVEVRTGTTGSFTTLSNVQNIDLSIGRQRQLDAYQASKANVTLRYPSGFYSPIAAIAPGSQIRIVNATTATILFRGSISNVNVQYGIPYASNVGVSDYLHINCEGSLATFGRMAGEGYAMAKQDVQQQMFDAANETNTSSYYLGPTTGGTGPTLEQSNVDSTWGDWVTKTAQTINGRIMDSVDFNTVALLDPQRNHIATINFSDTANNATNQVYDRIDFHGLADNYYTQVTVDPETHSAATATSVGASKPYRTLTMNTFSASTSAAQDYADYLLGYYNQPTVGIASISCLAEAQNTFELDNLGPGSYGANFATSIGTQVDVAFRGTTLTCIIEGANVTAQPGSARFTFYLSAADLNAYLILDNTTFGKLDFNKLGYI